MNELKKRKRFASLEKFELKKAKESIRTIPGEKTEAEFKSYGIHCKKKNTERKFNPYQTKLLAEQKEIELREDKENKIRIYIEKSISKIMKG